MNVNNNIENTIYTHATLTKNDTDSSATNDERNIRIKESFDLSILHANSAKTYDSHEANTILKDVNFANEVKSFSKENILERFTQPLAQAQAHLSSDSVNKLLQ